MKPEQTPITGKKRSAGLPGELEALVQFYDAFNNCDREKMSLNWAQSDEIAMDNPLGGIKRGWNEIEAVYARLFNGSAKVYVELYDYTFHRTDNMFFVVGRERGEFCLGETRVEFEIRTSKIYQLIDGTWKQVHHHGSIDDPGLLDQYQKAIKSLK